MTVTTTNSSQTFQGNGTAKAFPCAFAIFQNTDVDVFFVNPITGVQTPALLNSDYTITGAGASNGFTVNTTVPVPTGTNLYVERVLPYTQPTDFTNQGDFFPTLHQAAIDRLCMLIQQIANLSGLTLSFAPGLFPQPSNLFPGPSANQLIGWNSDGSALENIPPGDGGTTLFAQPATGATSRPIIGKVQETVSITDFMTAAQIADSRTGIAPTLDSSAAIQAAANYAVANGLKLIAPAGRYLCSNITLSNLTLEGAGTIDLGYDAAVPGIGNKAHSGTQFYVTDTAHSLFIVMSGCRLSGFSVYYPNQTGAAFTANSNTPITYLATINIPTNNENIHITDVGSANCYQFLQIGSQSSTNAVGRIFLKNLRVYSIYNDMTVDVLRDILNMENCSFTYGWWDGNECGSVVNGSTIPNLATWTARNGRSVILETTDGVAASNCFFFAKAAVIQAIAGSESQPGLGQSQYNRFVNCLFDGCGTPVQAVFGGYFASTVFANCVFSDLSPGNFPGTYPAGIISNDSTAASSDITFNNCRFIGGREHQVSMSNPCGKLTFNGCVFSAWMRYVSASDGSAVYLNATSTDVVFNGCSFDPSGTASSQPNAIECQQCSSLTVTGCVFNNCYAPIMVGPAMSGKLTVSGCISQSTASPYAVAFQGAVPANVAISGSNQFDKPAAAFGNAKRCKVGAVGSAIGTIGATQTTLTWVSKTIDTLSAFNPSTGIFTAPSQGRYRVSVNVTHQYTVTANDSWKIMLLQNGADVAYRLYQVLAAQFNTVPFAADVSMNAGDTLAVAIARYGGSGNFPVLNDGAATQLAIEIMD